MSSRPLLAAILLSTPIVLAVVGAACGGTVVFTEDGGTGGQTNDDDGPPPPDGPGPMSAGPTGVTTGPTTTGPGPTTTGPGPGPTSSAISTGSGLECDDGQVHDVNSFECQNCTDCAQQKGACSEALDSCFSNDECSQFIDCYQNCSDDMCAQQCVDEHPEGFQLYLGAINCIYCDQCPNNCDGPSIGCPFQ